MFAVQGIYVDGNITINEPVPVRKKYDVIVTFLKPASQEENNANKREKIAALNRITGILSDSDITLEEARAERLSRQ
jgi:hypothetical protein